MFSDMTMVVIILGFGFLFMVYLFFLMMGERDGLQKVIKAMEDTGILGDTFLVTLSDGRVVIAGAIMSADEAKNYFYELKDGYEVVTRHRTSISENCPSSDDVVLTRLHLPKK